MPVANDTDTASSWQTTATNTRENGKMINGKATGKPNTTRAMSTLGTGRIASAIVMEQCTLKMAMSMKVDGTLASRMAPERTDGGMERWISVATAQTIV